MKYTLVTLALITTAAVSASLSCLATNYVARKNFQAEAQQRGFACYSSETGLWVWKTQEQCLLSATIPVKNPATTLVDDTIPMDVATTTRRKN